MSKPGSKTGSFKRAVTSLGLATNWKKGLEHQDSKELTDKELSNQWPYLTREQVRTYVDQPKTS